MRLKARSKALHESVGRYIKPSVESTKVEMGPLGRSESVEVLDLMPCMLATRSRESSGACGIETLFDLKRLAS